MKIIQLFKSESGDIALDDKGNIYRVLTVIGEGKTIDAHYWGNELKFIKIKQVFEDRIKE